MTSELRDMTTKGRFTLTVEADEEDQCFYVWSYDYLQVDAIGAPTVAEAVRLWVAAIEEELTMIEAMP